MNGRPTIYTQYQYWICVINSGNATAREVAEMLMISRETALMHLNECVDAGTLMKQKIGTEYVFTKSED